MNPTKKSSSASQSVPVTATPRRPAADPGSNIPPNLQTLNSVGLGKILHKSHLTIEADLSRAPERLPPPIRRTAGGAALWLPLTVLEWLKEQEEEPRPPRPKRGRPTKLEQEARRARKESPQ